MKKELINLLDKEIDPAFARRASIILKEVEKEKPKVVLDAGCGRGFYLKALSYFSFIKKIYGIDINKKYLEIAKRINNDPRVVIKHGSIYNLPFSDNFFDLIICSEVLEHLKNDGLALKELKRVLKPKGRLIITVPNIHFPFFWDPLNWILMKFFNTHINKDIWWLAGIWADHQRLYDKNELGKKLQKTGFLIEKSWQTTHYCLPFSHFLLYGIGKNLVEIGLMSSFNRFNPKRKFNIFSQIIAFPFKLIDRFNQKETNKSSVNLIFKLRK
jgi:SAM-dependent methyltransferase